MECMISGCVESISEYVKTACLLKINQRGQNLEHKKIADEDIE